MGTIDANGHETCRGQGLRKSGRPAEDFKSMDVRWTIFFLLGGGVTYLWLIKILLLLFLNLSFCLPKTIPQCADLRICLASSLCCRTLQVFKV